MTIGRLFRTVRHLTSRQIFYRLKYGLGFVGKTRPFSVSWGENKLQIPLVKPGQKQLFMGDGCFRFINVEGNLENGWNNTKHSKLWLYQLHYQEWLFDPECDAEFWIKEWIASNPPFSGNGWEPYPLSLRIFNWIKFFVHSQEMPNQDVMDSLALQCAHLFKYLEFQHGANHLLENLFALKAASLIITEDKMNQRVDLLLKKELENQFLADGAHFERSPMYHAILMERMLDLANILPRTKNRGLMELLEQKIRLGLDWLSQMSVGGRFALFNDSGYDSAPAVSEVFEYGNKLLGWERPGNGEDGKSLSVMELRDSGYYRCDSERYSIIIDNGPLGPGENMAHAHCDMLSYCLWINDVPAIVDSGNYDYLPGKMRDSCRSTRAHNTCTVGEEEQAECWKAHRVGRRGYPMAAGLSRAEESVVFEGLHSGFSHLKGTPVHSRRIEMEDGSIEVLDRIQSKEKHLLRSYIHLHPDCDVEVREKHVIVMHESFGFRIECSVEPVIEKGWYCPEFNLRVENQVVVLSSETSEIMCRIEII